MNMKKCLFLKEKPLINLIKIFQEPCEGHPCEGRGFIILSETYLIDVHMANFATMHVDVVCDAVVLEVLFSLAKPPRRINHPNTRVCVGSLPLHSPCLPLPSLLPSLFILNHLTPYPLPLPPFPAEPALTVKSHGHAHTCAPTKSGAGNAGLIRLESS